MNAYTIMGTNVAVGIQVNTRTHQWYISVGREGKIMKVPCLTDAPIEHTVVPCPMTKDVDFTNDITNKGAKQCDECGAWYGPWRLAQGSNPSLYYRDHPASIKVSGPDILFEAGVLRTPDGKFFITRPIPGDRILVLWTVGVVRGTSLITPGPGVVVIGCTNYREAEASMLAIVPRGGEIRAERYASGLVETHAKLRFDEYGLTVQYGTSALCEDVSERAVHY